MPIAPAVLPVNVDTTGAQILGDDADSSPDQRDSRGIYLPNHVESVSHIAVDVGGSLAKVVYFTRSRLSSATQQPGESSKASTSSSQSERKPASPSFPPAVSSRSHSRQASANGSAPRPFTPDLQSNGHSIPSGSLTPTAILNKAPPHLGSAVNAARASLLKRRSLPPTLPGGRLNFIKFETSDIESCIEFLRELIESSAKANNVSIEEMRKGVKLMATGGGAHLFYDLFESGLGVEVQKEDEMGCLITGLNFITLIPDEVFWYSDELVSALHSPLPPSDLPRADPSITPCLASPAASGSSSSSTSPGASTQPEQPLPRPSPNPPLYAPMFDSDPTPKLPCLLVNIGSGVSMIKVDDYGKFERVSGTSLGGGTLWGLLSLLTDADSFDEMLELSEMGDNSTVDMLVADVYGNSTALNAFGLKSSTIASSFGKVFRKDAKSSSEGGASGRKKKFRPEDICKSLLYAVSNNIGQIAHMTAEKYDLDRIYFGGCFIRGHQATISTLSYAIRFWSKGTKRAFFLRHEGYLGAIGAWIKHLDEELMATSSSTTAGRAASDASIPSSSTDVAPMRASANRHQRESSAQSSLDLPTPIAEEGDHLAAEAQAATPAPESVRPAVNGVPDGNANRTRQARAEGMEMLSMLNSLQEDHRALVEPVVRASNGLTNGVARGGGEEEDDEDVDLEGVESEEDIAALLAQLDAANGAADGLESKLDGLLSKLDGLLAAGEESEVAPEGRGNIGR